MADSARQKAAHLGLNLIQFNGPPWRRLVNSEHPLLRVPRFSLLPPSLAGVAFGSPNTHVVNPNVYIYLLLYRCMRLLVE